MLLILVYSFNSFLKLFKSLSLQMKHNNILIIFSFKTTSFTYFYIICFKITNADENFCNIKILLFITVYLEKMILHDFQLF
jgi:hypothetical protein